MPFRININSYILGNYTGGDTNSFNGTNLGISEEPLKYLNEG